MYTNRIPEYFLPLWWIKLTRFEFWPFWVFYLPMFLYGLCLAIKNWSLTYYTRVNPGMNAGGIAGEGKLNLLKQIAPEFVPKTVMVDADSSLEQIQSVMFTKQIAFPCLIKPNRSERGIGVEVIQDSEAMNNYFSLRDGEFLIQELVSFPLEFGVLYFRFPDGRSGITSIVQKEFLTICGDGNLNIEQLIRSSTRARFRLSYLLNKFKNRLNEILKNGEELLLEPIGNHNRGTTFLNNNHLINQDMVKVFDVITESITGFNYGRFDLKVNSTEDLNTGNGIRILEVNGVESEPAHIYDPKMNLFKAYRDVINHMNLISKIAAANKKSGISSLPLRNFIFAVRQHLKQRSLYTVS